MGGEEIYIITCFCLFSLMLFQVDLIAAELRKLGATPWLLDGFPRTRSQVSTFSLSTLSASVFDPNPMDLALMHPDPEAIKLTKNNYKKIHYLPTAYLPIKYGTAPV
jgi:hypothetical protein